MVQPRQPTADEKPGEVVNAVLCTDRGVHVWAYMGKERQSYRCIRCGGTINKVRLKSETD